MAKLLRVDPNILVGDEELGAIAKYNSISKPSYFEYELLPAKWIDTMQIIKNEMSIAGQNG